MEMPKIINNLFNNISSFCLWIFQYFAFGVLFKLFLYKYLLYLLFQA